MNIWMKEVFDIQPRQQSKEIYSSG